MSDAKTQATSHAHHMMDALGLTPEADQELAKTPSRLVGLLEDLFTGINAPPPTLSTFDVDDMSRSPVMLIGIKFQSMCVHHLLPFFGTLDVAYVPDQKIVGFGSIPRVIDHFAAQPQMQERMVKHIADHLEAHLAPKGLLIRCRARQLCMEYRGSKRSGELLSLASRGCLKEGATRQEILNQFLTSNAPL